MGTSAAGPNNIILGGSAAIIANTDLNFFPVASLVSASVQMQLVITEIQATVVPVPASLPPIASGIFALGWWRRRQRC
jgi:hypothetical protein